MAERRTFAGELEQYDVPRWGPLEDLLGPELCGRFMWMHEVRLTDRTAVHAYKHKDTRRYIHLAPSGTTYAYTRSGRYRLTPAADVVEEAFFGLVDLGSGRTREVEGAETLVRRLRAMGDL